MTTNTSTRSIPWIKNALRNAIAMEDYEEAKWLREDLKQASARAKNRFIKGTVTLKQQVNND